MNLSTLEDSEVRHRYLFRFEEPLKYLVHQLKFGHRPYIGRLLGEIWSNAMLGLQEKPHLLIPVPLHALRYLSRGYNQSMELGRVLSERLAIPVNQHYVTRQRHTQAQTTLQAEERGMNIKNAFQSSTPSHIDFVAIIDDVYTTGATTRELARVLRSSDQQRIEIWTLAKA